MLQEMSVNAVGAGPPGGRQPPVLPTTIPPRMRTSPGERAGTAGVPSKSARSSVPHQALVSVAQPEEQNRQHAPIPPCRKPSATKGPECRSGRADKLHDFNFVMPASRPSRTTVATVTAAASPIRRPASTPRPDRIEGRPDPGQPIAVVPDVDDARQLNDLFHEGVDAPIALGALAHPHLDRGGKRIVLEAFGQAGQLGELLPES